MKTTARLLLVGAIAAASSFAVAAPASACDDPRKCASCRLDPLGPLEGDPPFWCYS